MAGELIILDFECCKLRVLSRDEPNRMKLSSGQYNKAIADSFGFTKIYSESINLSELEQRSFGNHCFSKIRRFSISAQQQLLQHKFHSKFAKRNGGIFFPASSIQFIQSSQLRLPTTGTRLGNCLDRKCQLPCLPSANPAATVS